MAPKDKEEIGPLAALAFEDIKAIMQMGLPLDQIKELTASGYDVNQIKELASILPKVATSTGGLSKDDLKELLAGQAAGMKQALKPENFPSKNTVSAFNPDGLAVRPTLGYRAEDGSWKPRPTFFVGSRLTEDMLTNEEIEAYNSITEDHSSRNGQWTAEVRQNGKTQELWIKVPYFEPSDRMNLPTFEGAQIAICLELKSGEKSANPLALMKRVAALEAEAAQRATAAVG